MEIKLVKRIFVVRGPRTKNKIKELGQTVEDKNYSLDQTTDYMT